MLREFFKKERPLLGMAGFGGGIASRLVGGVAGSVSGGNVDGLEPGNGYKYHTFTSPGTLVVVGDFTMEVLMVAGGGTGGSDGGAGGTGGGGGGGLLFGSLDLTTGSYPINVGATTADSAGTQGNNTTGFGATANGGGYGGEVEGAGNDGGSGGGGSAGGSVGAGGASTQSPQPLPYGTLTGFGGAGSSGISPPARIGGGGGGAGGDAPPQPGTAVPSGPGKQYPNFTGPLIGVPALAPLSGYYAGGGGGGRTGLGSPDGSGGAGSPDTSTNGSDGVTNSGGGGGGASRYPSNGTHGGTGASGIVVVRYAV